MLRIKNYINGFADAKFQAIISLQSLAINALSIDERAMLAGLINHTELAILRNDEGMFARNPRIGDDQIFVNLAPHCKGTVIKIDGALLVPLHKNQRGKDARTCFRSRIDNAR